MAIQCTNLKWYMVINWVLELNTLHENSSTYLKVNGNYVIHMYDPVIMTALLTYFLHFLALIWLLLSFPVVGRELILLLEFEGDFLVGWNFFMVYQFEDLLLHFLIQNHVVLQICELVVEFTVYSTLSLLMDLLN